MSKSKSWTPNCRLDVTDFYNLFLKFSDPENDILYVDVVLCNELERLINDDIVITFDERNVHLVHLCDYEVSNTT